MTKVSNKCRNIVELRTWTSTWLQCFLTKDREENFITGKLIFFKYSTSKLFYNDPG